MFGLFNPNIFAADLSTRFVDSEYGYSINYPQNWNAKINRSGMVLADINSQNNQAGLQIRITESDKPLGAFVENYIEQFKQDMQAQLLTQESIKINKIQAYAISFIANRRGNDYMLLNYIVPDEQTGRVFIFQAGTPYILRYEILPVLDAIVGSFKLN